METMDIIGIFIFFLCTIVYHASYPYIMRRFPERVVKTHINALRRAWIEFVIERKEFFLASNQARDLINVNTFLASAILIFIGAVLNLLLNVDKVENLKIITAQNFELKILFLLAILMVSFFNFLSSLRNLRIFTMLLPVPPDIVKKETGQEAVDYFTRKMNLASTYYTLGSRGMFYTIPVIFWLVSAEAFIAVTLLMTINFALRKDYRKQGHTAK
jgi:uncharacterized membrane protein